MHQVLKAKWTAVAGAFVALATVVPATGTAAAPQPPNILWLTTEDLSPVLGCYGDGYAVTPNLDRLAAQGVRYTHAFAMASVCTPARSCLITGIYSSSLGTQHLRGEQPLPEGVRCFSEFLREAGYYCTNNVKEDYNFKTPEAAWDESSNKAHWRGRKPGQPFFAVFNFMTTHQSRVRFRDEQLERVTARLAPEQRHDPAKAPLPPYYPDTPVVRRDVAQLYDLVTAMDYQVRDMLAQLDEDGLADNTIVFFYGDHGTGIPRGKRFLHDSGTRVPLLIRFPEKYRHLAPGKPGTTCDRLVSFVDFAPTVLSLVGLPIPDYVQGTVFLGAKQGEPREFVYAIRDRVDEVMEFSRSVRDRRWLYIRNYYPHRPRLQHSTYSELTPTRQELRRLSAAGKLTGAAADLMGPTKPAEELYDAVSDPHQVHNLAAEPEHAERLLSMRAKLHTWMVATRDTSLLPEVDMCRRSKGGSPYAMAQGESPFHPAGVLNAAELVGRGPGQLDNLREALGARDPAVQFWGATGLAALGPQAAPATDELKAALADDAPNVRLAAAEVLCNLGHEEEALPVLLGHLTDEDPRVQLTAAIHLAAVAEKARSIKPQIEEIARRIEPRGTFPMYTRWALDYALEKMGQ